MIPTETPSQAESTNNLLRMVFVLESLQTGVQLNCVKLTECLRVEKTHIIFLPPQREGRQPPSIIQRLFFQGLTERNNDTQ